MGEQTAAVLQSTLASAAGKTSGIFATLIGILTLLITASGVFGEMQSALNAISKVTPQGTSVSRLVRARAASLGLVAALGFLLLVSLVVIAGLAAFGNYLNSFFFVRTANFDRNKLRRFNCADLHSIRCDL
jgi:membrane protein